MEEAFLEFVLPLGWKQRKLGREPPPIAPVLVRVTLPSNQDEGRLFLDLTGQDGTEPFRQQGVTEAVEGRP